MWFEVCVGDKYCDVVGMYTVTCARRTYIYVSVYRIHVYDACAQCTASTSFICICQHTHTHTHTVMELARMASSITTEIIFSAITLSGITYYIHNTWLVCV
jgi:hypothetical protein